MSTADPFLPVQPAQRHEGADPLEPQDFYHGDTEPDVFDEPSTDEAADDAETPPARPTVFDTPTGESIDPAQDN